MGLSFDERRFVIGCGVSFLKWLLDSDIANGAVILVFFGLFSAGHSAFTKRDLTVKWMISYFIVSMVGMILFYRFIINPALRS